MIRLQTPCFVVGRDGYNGDPSVWRPLGTGSVGCVGSSPRCCKGSNSPNITFQCGAGHSIRIFSPNQLRCMSLCRCHKPRTYSILHPRSSLPLLTAFISEALRWRPLGPNGFPHRTTKDVIWENYCIPAGTTVLGNHWAISRDAEVYPDPDAFKPQRWINDQGRLRDDLTYFVYGFGRRICPGLHLANRSVWINSVLVLWAFQLTLDPTKPVDDVGFMRVEMPHVSCPIEFKPRVPDAELRRMMDIYPEVE